MLMRKVEKVATDRKTARLRSGQEKRQMRHGHAPPIGGATIDRTTRPATTTHLPAQSRRLPPRADTTEVPDVIYDGGGLGL